MSEFGGSGITEELFDWIDCTPTPLLILVRVCIYNDSRLSDLQNKV